MENTRIGIVGMGVVGKAVYNAFSPVYPDILTFDIEDPDSCIARLYDREFIFICTPADQVQSTAYAIAEASGRENIVFILKSTVPPGTTEELQHICGNEWVFCPEFLTDRTANLDFINAPRFIIGGTGGHGVEMVTDLYRHRFRHTRIIKTTSRHAEFVKYMTNLFFMTKVTFMNEMFDASKELGLSWDSVVNQFISDGRIGNSHLQVPGPDGKRGFGGKCFPENINTYLDWSARAGVNDELIKTVRELNDVYRNK